MSRLPSLLDDIETSAGAPETTHTGVGMLARLRLFLSSGVGLTTIAVLAAFALTFVGWRAWSFAGAGGPDWPRIRVMDPDTGDLRWVEVRPGRTLPYRNPKTGTDSMYPVEYCFDNQCGGLGGTPNVLNVFLGIDGPTSCRVCGHTIVGHNPRPPEFNGVTPADQR